MGGGRIQGLSSRCCMRRGGVDDADHASEADCQPAVDRPPDCRALVHGNVLTTERWRRERSPEADPLVEWRSVSCPTSTRRLLRLNRPSSKGSSTSSSSERPIRSSVRCGRRTSRIGFPAGARVAEVGCGPGPVARALVSQPGVATVVGVDPSPIFIAKGRELARDIPNLRFVEGDARALPLEDGSLDVLVFHTTLCHVPGPERALNEASAGSRSRRAARHLRRRLRHDDVGVRRF